MLTTSRIWRTIKRAAIWLAGFVLIALLAGAAFQVVTTRLDEGKYPPPGQMVDVAGHSIHLNCSGSGAPTVVLEAGLGGGSLDWALVQPEVANRVAP